ncbi:MAG TPA: hypothetical protein PKI11_12355, partial [Candidatus Hydrogenedentes bacterium]|nr:hypothetical protein [Candidatus Hydrogenedentota bacterium]
VGMMTGIAWGGYEAYFGSGDAFKKDEIQTAKDGRLYMHGQSTTIGYNVPTTEYVEFLKKYVEPAVEAGVRAVFLEEPEYWAETGWSEAFKREWQAFYGEPWQPPDSSPDAQYRASKLKYELYFRALREVFRHVKAKAAERGAPIECHVPTHSLINYAQWRIVSPESRLMDLEEMDGYIAQVWTGTARSQNLYRGVMKERTFETAYLEYGQMLGMVRPTGRKVWFLADPIEDNPNYSWKNYQYNYECTLIASLMWPEVHHFEVMPWPDRIFRGSYPKVDLDTKSGEREGIPAEYATQLLIAINALNEMDQGEVEYDTGTRGIAVVVSDTMMFQRALPDPSDPALASFYALALPLVKHGLPIEIVQLENTPHPDALKDVKVLVMTYEGQKPLKPDYHEAIDRWVRAGGCLLFVDDGADPYHGVREWWNEDGAKPARAYDDLFARLGIGVTARNEPERVGEGYVRVFVERPRRLPRYPYGARKIVELVAELLERRGETLKTQHYLRLRRGPFIVVSVLDESVSDDPVSIEGAFVDLFDAHLPVVTACSLAPNERTLLYDLEWARARGVTAKVVAAGSRIRNEKPTDTGLAFTARGPLNTTGRARVLLPGPPKSVTVRPEAEIEQAWDETSRTLLLTYPNVAADLCFDVAW